MRCVGLGVDFSKVNDMDAPAFAAALGWVFEHSPWVARAAWTQRPFGSVAALHGAMVAAVERAGRPEQLALLRAHPDLGTRARVAAASEREQAGAGLDRLSPEECARFDVLNAAYRERFGFPFIFAVKGSSKHDILRDLELRQAADPAEEFQRALEHVYRIARLRLEDAAARE